MERTDEHLLIGTAGGRCFSSRSMHKLHTRARRPPRDADGRFAVIKPAIGADCSPPPWRVVDYAINPAIREIRDLLIPGMQCLHMAFPNLF